jgi:hypothetical protein
MTMARINSFDNQDKILAKADELIPLLVSFVMSARSEASSISDAIQ